jgi:fatty-acyl-CoA synthase
VTDNREEKNTARAAWLRALEMTRDIGRDPILTFPVVIERLAAKYGDAPALLSDDARWSYRELAQRANRMARWTLAQGMAPGDTVALFMANAPEYLAIWLGITRVGGIVALVNANLADDALLRAIALVKPKHAIAGGGLAGALAAIAPRLTGVRCWTYGAANEQLPRLDEEVARLSGDPLPAATRSPRISDPALYIYTSGTTGLSKAAHVSHERIMQWSHWFAGMMDTKPGDRMYDCLPMYHGLGGVVAVGAPLLGGGSVAIRAGFSASRFWDDVARFDCTLFQYIGELTRYLAASAPHPLEHKHRIRLCCGSGMSAGVWRKFAERFEVPRILEFYASTEGVVSLYNAEGRPGAIGRVPPFLAHRAGVALVVPDLETGAPRRDANGGCIPCAADEVGEAVGRIGAGGERFLGYSDAAEGERKILRDVFAKGDQWFRTGDLMRHDRAGYFYFVDRIGDTFRWKGENVSTTEVAETIAACPGVSDVAVYGVRVPGVEGRAGMAAIVAGREFDPADLARYLGARLPSYARPLFLRLRPALDLTATLRPRKQELIEEGFDPAKISEPLFFNDQGSFVPLDAGLYGRIAGGMMRL